MTDDTRSYADILRAAKARISEVRHFVSGAGTGTGALAWDARGREVDPLSPAAVRFNARAAIYVESGIRTTSWKDSGTSRAHRLYDLYDAAVRPLAYEAATRPGMQWLRNAPDPSDNLGHALTLRALDDAAALAEAEQPVATAP